NGEFRERALPAEQTLVGPPDTVADLEAVCTRSGGLDGSGKVAAGDEGFGKRHCHGAGADVDVDRVERRGAYADEHFALSGLRRGQFADADHVGTASRFEEGCSHAGPTPVPCVDEKPALVRGSVIIIQGRALSQLLNPLLSSMRRPPLVSSDNPFPFRRSF